MTPLFQKKFWVLLAVFIVASIVFFFNFYPSKPQPITVSPFPTNGTTSQQVSESKHGSCLADNEVVEYDRISQHPLLTQPKEISPVIYVRDKTSGEITTSFQLDDVRASGHPMEVHKCGVYFVREFNYNPKVTNQAIGYREELWEYDYGGREKH